MNSAFGFASVGFGYVEKSLEAVTATATAIWTVTTTVAGIGIAAEFGFVTESATVFWASAVVASHSRSTDSSPAQNPPAPAPVAARDPSEPQ